MGPKPDAWNSEAWDREERGARRRPATDAEHGDGLRAAGFEGGASVPPQSAMQSLAPGTSVVPPIGAAAPPPAVRAREVGYAGTPGGSGAASTPASFGPASDPAPSPFSGGAETYMDEAFSSAHPVTPSIRSGAATPAEGGEGLAQRPRHSAAPPAPDSRIMRQLKLIGKRSVLCSTCPPPSAHLPDDPQRRVERRSQPARAPSSNNSAASLAPQGVGWQSQGTAVSRQGSTVVSPVVSERTPASKPATSPRSKRRVPAGSEAEPVATINSKMLPSVSPPTYSATPLQASQHLPAPTPSGPGAEAGHGVSQVIDSRQESGHGPGGADAPASIGDSSELPASTSADVPASFGVSSELPASARADPVNASDGAVGSLSRSQEHTEGDHQYQADAPPVTAEPSSGLSAADATSSLGSCGGAENWPLPEHRDDAARGRATTEDTILPKDENPDAEGGIDTAPPSPDHVAQNARIQRSTESEETAPLEAEEAATVAGGAQGQAMIWPGRPATKQEILQHEAFGMQKAAAPHDADYGGGFSWPEADPATGARPGAWLQPAMVPPVVMQNEAGSLVVPTTWRFVPPPGPKPVEEPVMALPNPVDPAYGAQFLAIQPVVATPPAAQPQEGVEVSTLATQGVGEAEVEQARVEARGLEEKIEQTLPAAATEPMDTEAKVHVLYQLIASITARTERYELALGSEQRANRALRTTLEDLHRQNVSLQQQLAWVTQSWGYMKEGDLGAQVMAMPPGAAMPGMGYTPG